MGQNRQKWQPIEDGQIDLMMLERVPPLVQTYRGTQRKWKKKEDYMNEGIEHERSKNTKEKMEEERKNKIKQKIKMRIREQINSVVLRKSNKEIHSLLIGNKVQRPRMCFTPLSTRMEVGSASISKYLYFNSHHVDQKNQKLLTFLLEKSHRSFRGKNMRKISTCIQDHFLLVLELKTDQKQRENSQSPLSQLIVPLLNQKTRSFSHGRFKGDKLTLSHDNIFYTLVLQYSSIKLMQGTLTSQNNLLAPPPESTSPTFSIITYDRRNYRVHTGEFKACEIMSFFWGLTFVLFLFIDIAILIDDIYSLSGIAACGMAVGCGVLLSIFAIKNRQFLKPFFIFSIICMTTLLLGWLILLCIKEKGFIIVSGVVIFIDLMVSLVLLENKSLIFGKCMFLGSFIMVSLKLDYIITAPWSTTLFLLIMLASVATVSTVFIGIFFLISACAMSVIPTEKKCGLGFIAFFSLAISMNAAIPLFQVLFKTQMWIGATAAFVSTSLFIAYLVVFNTGIKLFLCQTDELKTFTHHVQLIPMRKQKHCDYRFEELSPSWFQKVFFSKKETKNMKKCEKIEQVGCESKAKTSGQCLVCLQSDAQVIWMPCGHLIVCTSCCQLMFAKKNASCLLCKVLPTEVYVIEEKKKSVEKEMEVSFRLHEVQKQENPTGCANQTNLEKSSSKVQCFDGTENRWFHIHEGYEVQIC